VVVKVEMSKWVWEAKRSVKEKAHLEIITEVVERVTEVVKRYWNS
jgi:hypothetical protein